MYGLVSIRFLKRFMKGIRGSSNLSSAPGAETLVRSSAKSMNPSGEMKKTTSGDEAAEYSQKIHDADGVSGKQSTI
ncbi:MAG TPA: hypothetical protein VLX61_03070 [Anaerolineales bacterium]|nr:hypothetical protein [Anaerolineales bacterium]